MTFCRLPFFLIYKFYNRFQQEGGEGVLNLTTAFILVASNALN